MQLVFLQVGLLYFFPLSSLLLPITPRLILTDVWNSYFNSDTNGPGTYSFGFDLEDAESGNVQFRIEEKFRNGTITGSYGLLEPDGNVKIVKYKADSLGYRAVVENSQKVEPKYHPARPVKFPSDIDETVRSPDLENAVNSLEYFGQTIEDQHTPPKFLSGLRRNLFRITWGSPVFYKK